MNTVAILPIADASGEQTYRAVAGKTVSVGKTAGQALDTLTRQLGETEFRALLVIQSFQPDSFFNAGQQQRLSELMDAWRAAKAKGELLLPEQQAELDALVEAELKAATARTSALLQQQTA